VATATVASARIRLLRNESSMLESSQTDPSAQQYHCVEKPCHVLRDRPALNENCTAMRIGTSDQTM